MKYLKKINEEYEIYLNNEVIETDNKELFDVFDLTIIDTKIEIDLNFHIEIGLGIVAQFCVDNNLLLNKKIINDLVIRIKLYTKEYVLYRDDEHIDWNDEYSWVVTYLIDNLKEHLPNEYKKYMKRIKAKKFNI